MPFKSMFPVPLNNFLWLGPAFQSLHHLLRHLRDSWPNHIFRLSLYILKANLNFLLRSSFCCCDKILRSKATYREMQFVSVYTWRSWAITEGSQVRHSGRIHGEAPLLDLLRGSGSPSFLRQLRAFFTGNGTAHNRLGLCTSINNEDNPYRETYPKQILLGNSSSEALLPDDCRLYWVDS